MEQGKGVVRACPTRTHYLYVIRCHTRVISQQDHVTTSPRVLCAIRSHPSPRRPINHDGASLYSDVNVSPTGRSGTMLTVFTAGFSHSITSSSSLLIVRSIVTCAFGMSRRGSVASTLDLLGAIVCGAEADGATGGAVPFWITPRPHKHRWHFQPCNPSSVRPSL